MVDSRVKEEDIYTFCTAGEGLVHLSNNNSVWTKDKVKDGNEILTFHLTRHPNLNRLLQPQTPPSPQDPDDEGLPNWVPLGVIRQETHLFTVDSVQESGPSDPTPTPPLNEKVEFIGSVWSTDPPHILFPGHPFFPTKLGSRGLKRRGG